MSRMFDLEFGCKDLCLIMCFDLLCTSIGTSNWGGCIKAQQLSGWSRWCKWGATTNEHVG
jgi:hypothetical protein